RQEAASSIFEYIEVFYNRQRRHSSVNNNSPFNFEQQYFLNPLSIYSGKEQLLTRYNMGSCPEF
ncbi:TPA: hypothetical protein ENS27_19070, partial [bacterium]|nr:hypothetical protein [bacterium]